MNSDVKIIFIHIPKASGSSARKFFEDAFGKESVAWLGSNFKKDALDIKNNVFFNKYKVIGGHFSFAVAQNIPGRKVYVSVYRDAISRVISLYRYIQRTPEHHLHIDSLRYSIVRMIEKNPLFKAQVSNQQSKFLSGLPLCSQHVTKMDDVIDNLYCEQFFLCNITNVAEMFSEIARMFNISGEVMYGRANSSKVVTDKDVIWDDSVAIKKLDEINLVDVELSSYLDDRLVSSKYLAPNLNLGKCARKKSKRSSCEVEGAADVFLHVPKTGGTSLHNVLLANYHEDDICPARLNNLRTIDSNEINKYRFFSGHYDWASLSFVEREKKIVTLLRNPKKRIVSLFQFWRSHTWEHIERHGLAGPKLAKSYEFADFLGLEGSGVPINVDNVLTRNFLGRTYIGKGRDFLYPDDEVFDRAYENISCLDAVGFMEFMKPSVDRIVSTLGFDAPDVIPRERDSNSFLDNPAMEYVAPPEITACVEEKLAQLTKYDSELYRASLDKIIPPLKKGERLSGDEMGVCFTDEWRRDLNGRYYTHKHKARLHLRVDATQRDALLSIDCRLSDGVITKLMLTNLGGLSEQTSTVVITKGEPAQIYIPISILTIDEFGITNVGLEVAGISSGEAIPEHRLDVLAISMQ